jgi:hypothetical protein
MRVLAVTFALATSATSLAQAQALAPLRLGDAVRVEARWLSDGWHIGTVRLTAEGCHIVVGPPVAAEPGARPALGLLRFMTRVQVALGSPSEWYDADLASIREPDTCVPMLQGPR